MSWLLVALIPGLLMLATFGLERVEAGLRRETISADEVAQFLDQAEASDVDALVRDGLDTAIHDQHRRRGEREAAVAVAGRSAAPPGLPTVRSFPQRVNTGFQQTPHANPV
ncbi:hypothetical protein ASG82_09660 [Mycobacterium sp. Soil538]|nr:hypothetical protein ASG82_09660 [Mycobacterium sp. Soil538]